MLSTIYVLYGRNDVHFNLAIVKFDVFSSRLGDIPSVRFRKKLGVQCHRIATCVYVHIVELSEPSCRPGRYVRAGYYYNNANLLFANNKKVLAYKTRKPVSSRILIA